MLTLYCTISYNSHFCVQILNTYSDCCGIGRGVKVKTEKLVINFDTEMKDL